MTASYTYLTDTGTIVEDTATLLSDIQGEWTIALGPTINTQASSPQGTLMANEAIARTSVMKNNADVANTINPNLSYGTFLDAICSLMGVTRGSNQSTVGLGLPVTGDPQTVIQAGSRVQTAAGAIFTIQSTVTIPVGGTTNVNVVSQAYGNIALPVGSMTILDGTIGWGSIAVVSGTTIVQGTLSLTDPQLKNVRTQRLANQGVGSSAAIQAAVMAVPNVTSCQVIENNTGAVGVVQGVTFTLANAMWVCVAGNPDPILLAQALYNAHNGGCPWDQGTSSGIPSLGEGGVAAPSGVLATDPATGVQYYVKSVTPVLYDCYVNITVVQGNSVSSPGPAVQTAILTYAQGGETGELGLVVGADVSAFEMAGAVARQLPGMYVRTCSVCVLPKGSTPPVYPTGFVTEVVMTRFQQAVLQLNNVTVQQASS
jgi:hypothetical protein